MFCQQTYPKRMAKKQKGNDKRNFRASGREEDYGEKKYGQK